jgi:hypothetical protein
MGYTETERMSLENMCTLVYNISFLLVAFMLFWPFPCYVRRISFKRTDPYGLSLMFQSISEITFPAISQQLKPNIHGFSATVIISYLEHILTEGGFLK